MSQTFICLANSYKHGNRCIVGVKIAFYPELDTFDVLKDERNNPIWFRPINRLTDAGSVPNAEAQKINILDVVKAHEIEHHPEGAQKENYYYSNLMKIGSIPLTIDNLDRFIDKTHKYLFGNRGIAVHPDKYNELDYSAIFIKCTDVQFYIKDRTQIDRIPQPRAIFKYNDIEYDLPITDPLFRQEVCDDLEKANSYNSYYFTISLGVENEGWHYKLIACVIPSPAIIQANDKNVSHFSFNSKHLKKDSCSITFDLFQQGLSIEQIAEKRNLAPGTIGTHLLSYIESGEIDIRQLVSDVKISRVLDYQRRHPEETKLKPYFEAFNEEISYTEIKWILASSNKKSESQPHVPF